VLLLDLALQLQLTIESLHAVGIKIGNLPVMENASIVQPLLELRRNAADQLEVVGLATRRLDALEGCRQLFGRRRLGLAEVHAGRSLGTLDAVDGRARGQIAVERHRATRIVVARN